MHQRLLFPFAALTAVLAAAPCCLDAGPPRKIAEFATVDELEAELDARLQELAPLLENAEEFGDNKKKVAQIASMLVVAAQALADHEEDSPRKAFAPDLRDAAMKVAIAGNGMTAQEGFAAAKQALDGKSSRTAEKNYDWAKLVKQRAIMEDTENRMQQLQRALRRPKDPAKESRLAVAIAIASLPTVVDTHEVKDPAKLPEWEKLSLQMLDQMNAIAKGIKSKDAMEANMQFKAARATCVECHRQFKVEN